MKDICPLSILPRTRSQKNKSILLQHTNVVSTDRLVLGQTSPEPEPTRTPMKRTREVLPVSTMPSSNKRKKKYALDATSNTPLGKAISMSPMKEEQEKRTFIEHEVNCVYRIIRKATGSLGGNAAGGAIYGEITQKSFARIMAFLKERCELTSKSRFIDIGSGLGKPNFHAAVDPGVELSYGMELEILRWQLSLHNLSSVLRSEPQRKKNNNKVIFTAGDITSAKTFDPFTHVYSFDTGFPPAVMEDMAQSFNVSSANYLASYHAPRKVIELYGYDVEHIGRVSTSMAGSSEGHTCHFYERILKKPKCEKKIIDPTFQAGIDLIKGGNDGILAWISDLNGQADKGGRTRRQRKCAKKVSPLKQEKKKVVPYCRTVPRKII